MDLLRPPNMPKIPYMAGMSADIVFASINAITVAVLAVLGINLSSRLSRRIAIYIIAGIGVLMSVLQAATNYDAQIKLQAHLDSIGTEVHGIKKDRERPITINVPPFSAPSEEGKQENSGNLFLDCHASMMPITVPASGHIHAIELFDVNVAAGVGGIADHFSEPGSHMKWNNTGLPDWAQQCEFSNYYKRTLLNVRTEFEIVIDDPQSRNAIFKWPIIISKLDPGSPNVFYIWNCCQQKTFLVRGPVTATGTFEGESLPTQVRIVRSELTASTFTNGFMMIQMPLKKPE